MLRIRLIGEPAELVAALAALQATPGLSVDSASPPKPARRDPGSRIVYIEATVTAGGEQR